MSRAKITTPNPVVSGRDKIIVRSLDPAQPSFVQNLTGRSKIHSVITQGSSISDTMRSGDIRVEDIAAGVIKDKHIESLTADKITAGTIDAGEITISSTDGKMTLAGNLFQIKNASDTIQVSIGKYSGSNYGVAIGSDPSSPRIVLNQDGMSVLGDFVTLTGGRHLYKNSGATVTTQVGYLLSNFCIYGDGANGIHLGPGNVTLCESGGSYGGGSKVVFVNNCSVQPSSDPSNGGILYVVGGELRYRGSSGSVTVIAPA